MSRAKRIEEAARALLDGIESPGTSPFPLIPADRLDALRAALALPEEESEVFWVVRRQGVSRWMRVPKPYHPTFDAARREVADMPGTGWEIVRVTVEGEESER